MTRPRVMLGLLVAALVTLVFAQSANAAIVSLNFSENKGNQHFDGGQLIGPLQTDSANWNNTNDYPGELTAGTMTNLVDDSGIDTGASVTWESAGVWWNNDGTTGDEHKMSVGYLDDGATSDGWGVQITINDVPFTNYRVYGLLANDWGDDTGEYNTRNFEVNGDWVFAGDDTTTAPAYGNIEASNAATGSYWSLADGTARGDYWAIDTSGSTLNINCLPRLGDSPGGSRGSITAVIIEATLAPLTWDENHVELSWNSAHWLPGGGPPDASTIATLAPTNTDTVVVDAPGGAAFSLAVDGGGIEISAGQTLSATAGVTFAPGTTLTMGADATLEANSGSFATVTTAGNATIDIATGTARVPSLTVGAPGTLTKAGRSTMVLSNAGGTGVSAAGAGFKVADGTLRSAGASPLGGATDLELAGGIFSFADEFGPPVGVPAGALAHWDFEEGAGTTAGNAANPGTYDGTLVDATWATDADRGSVLDFNGSTANVDISTLNLAANNLTLTGWVKSRTPGDWRGMVFSRGSAVTGMGYGDDDEFRYHWNDTEWGWSSGIDVPTNEWAFVALSASSDEDWATVYVWDGAVLASATNSVAMDPTTLDSLKLAMDWEGRNFGGLMDDVRIYDRALSPTDIADMLYSSQTAANMTGIDVLVTNTSTLNSRSGSVATFGQLTMQNGALTTSGNAGIDFTGTVIDPSATAVGFDPQVPTNYNGIANNSTQPTLTVSKTGPSTWAPDTPFVGTAGMSNVDWVVDDGVLEPASAEVMGTVENKRPLLINGGTFHAIGPDKLDNISLVTLNGGRLQVQMVNAATGPAGDAPADPIALWEFEETSGTTAQNSANPGTYDGTLAGGTTWTADVDRGNVLSFDGVDSVVNVFDMNSTFGELTFAGWIKGGAQPDWAAVLFSRGTGVTGMGYGDDGRLHYHWNDEQWWWNGGPVIPEDEWAFVAVSMQQDRAAAYLWDGTTLATGAQTTPHTAGPTTIDALEMGRDNLDPETTRYFAGLMDDLYVYDRAVTVGEIASMFGVLAEADLTNVELEVTNDSTIQADNAVVDVSVGNLSLVAGSLTTTVPLGRNIGFADTTIAATATAVGFDTLSDTYPGPISDLSTAPVVMAKTGPANLVLDEGVAAGLSANVTLDVQEGAVIAAPGGPMKAGPLGDATLRLNGGEAILAGATTASAVLYDNPVVVTAGSTLTAGSGGNETTEVEVTVGSDANGVDLQDSVLAVRSLDEYTLNVAGTIGGTGGISIAEGDVVLSAADNSVDTVLVTGGNLSTDGNDLTVNERMTIDTMEFTISEGNSFMVRSTDLHAGSDLTLTGGTLGVAGPPVTLTTSVNLTEREDQFVLPEEVAGLAGYEVSNWNNTAGEIGVDVELVDDSGVNTGMLLTWSCATTWGDGSAGFATPDARLARGYLDDGDPGATLDITGVVYDSYDVALYLSSDQGDGGPYGEYTVQDQTQAGGQIIPWGTNPSWETGRNALIFEDLAGDVLHIQGQPRDGSVRASIAGFQIRTTTAKAPVILPDVNVEATETSTLNPDTTGESVFGDVTLSDGVTLTVETAESLNLGNLNAGDGSTLAAGGGLLGFYFRGIINPEVSSEKASGPATTTISGYAEMDGEDGGYAVDFSGAENDLVIIQNGDIEVAGELSVQSAGKLDTVKDQVLTIMQLADPLGEDGIYGEFDFVPEVGDYLGYGAWFGNDKTGEGVRYVGRTYDPPEEYDPDDLATAVTMSVFQAKDGDCNGDRSISFADFNDLANNYTGALGPGVGGKEWRQGDYNGDADVDFGDFNDLANNYTGAGVEYGPGTPAGDAKAAPGEASLIVYLADVADTDGVSHAAGDVVLLVEGGESSTQVNGYEVYSAAGLLVPDEGGVPYPLIGGAYMEDSAAAIVAFGGLTSPLSVSGDQDWTLGWKYDVQAKAAGDLEFSYGTGGGVISGNVLYVVPEPGTLLLLACGGLGLLLWWRRRLSVIVNG